MALHRSLAEQFDGQVEVNYVDVIEDDMDLFPQVDDYLRQTGMKLPLITINGEPRPELGLSLSSLVSELKVLLLPQP